MAATKAQGSSASSGDQAKATTPSEPAEAASSTDAQAQSQVKAAEGAGPAAGNAQLPDNQAPSNPGSTMPAAAEDALERDEADRFDDASAPSAVQPSEQQRTGKVHSRPLQPVAQHHSSQQPPVVDSMAHADCSLSSVKVDVPSKKEPVTALQHLGTAKPIDDDWFDKLD